MKRSDMIEVLRNSFIHWMNYPETDGPQNDTEMYSNILKDLEEAGMAPPSIKASEFREKDYRWGAMCTMRCICNECNPNYPMHEWSKE